MSAGRFGTPSATAALEAACEEAAKSRSCDALAALRAARASQESLEELAVAHGDVAVPLRKAASVLKGLSEELRRAEVQLAAARAQAAQLKKDVKAAEAQCASHANVLKLREERIRELEVSKSAVQKSLQESLDYSRCQKTMQEDLRRILDETKGQAARESALLRARAEQELDDLRRKLTAKISTAEQRADANQRLYAELEQRWREYTAGEGERRAAMQADAVRAAATVAATQVAHQLAGASLGGPAAVEPSGPPGPATPTPEVGGDGGASIERAEGSATDEWKKDLNPRQRKRKGQQLKERACKEALEAQGRLDEFVSRKARSKARKAAALDERVVVAEDEADGIDLDAACTSELAPEGEAGNGSHLG